MRPSELESGSLSVVNSTLTPTSSVLTVGPGLGEGGLASRSSSAMERAGGAVGAAGSGAVGPMDRRSADDHA